MAIFNSYVKLPEGTPPLLDTSWVMPLRQCGVFPVELMTHPHVINSQTSKPIFRKWRAPIESKPTIFSMVITQYKPNSNRGNKPISTTIYEQSTVYKHYKPNSNHLKSASGPFVFGCISFNAAPIFSKPSTDIPNYYVHPKQSMIQPPYISIFSGKNTVKTIGFLLNFPWTNLMSCPSQRPRWPPAPSAERGSPPLRLPRLRTDLATSDQPWLFHSNSNKKGREKRWNLKKKHGKSLENIIKLRTLPSWNMIFGNFLRFLVATHPIYGGLIENLGSDRVWSLLNWRWNQSKLWFYQLVPLFMLDHSRLSSNSKTMQNNDEQRSLK